MKVTLIGRKNGIYVGSANAEDMDEARYTAGKWLQSGTMDSVDVMRPGQAKPAATLTK
jgi:hypothetical protein